MVSGGTGDGARPFADAAEANRACLRALGALLAIGLLSHMPVPSPSLYESDRFSLRVHWRDCRAFVRALGGLLLTGLRAGLLLSLYESDEFSPVALEERLLPFPLPLLFRFVRSSPLETTGGSS